MKTKFFVSLLSFLLLAFISYGQDSVRTRNDKPGTPQSLRTIDNAPKNKVHLIKTYKPQQQSIYHGQQRVIRSTMLTNLKRTPVLQMQTSCPKLRL